MDLQLEELQAVSVADVVREAVAVPHGAPRTFAALTLALVFPLSFAVLAHSLFTHPLFIHIRRRHDAPASDWLLLVLYQFVYLILLFTFSLLATGAVVFTVASLYAAKPVSFSSSLAAVRPIFPRLFRTFLWVAALMFVYNLTFALAFLPLFLFAPPSPSSSPFFILLVLAILLAFLATHVYISALWHLASVISVLEPLCGLAAMAKSRDLLRGRVRMASVLFLAYLTSCGLVGVLFRAVVVKGPREAGSLGVTSVAAKVLIGGALVAVLVVVILLGLLVQSIFYYVCKSYHHQQIDKSALYDHLGEYLGEYVPLKSSIQMENL